VELALLEKSLAKERPAPVWLIQGEELWMVEQAVRLVVTAAVGRMDDPMLVTRVDLAEGKKGARDILGACRSIGLFTSKVAVLVRAAELLDKRAEDKEELARYCENPAPGATLVLKASEQLDGRTAFMKRLAKHGKVLTYPLLKAWQAEKWVAERARHIGQRLDQDAAKLMVELVGAGLMGLELTLQQLSLFVGPGRPITRSDVEGALAATRARSIFELVDAIAEKKAPLAIRHVDAMLEQREHPPVILGSIVRHFRQLVEAKAIFEQGGGAADIQSALKVHEFVAKKLSEQVGRFDHLTLRICFEEFFRTELELKSTRIDPALRLEALLLRLCAPAPTHTRPARQASRRA
jgi:DNA polymerase-3 subunit delta